MNGTCGDKWYHSQRVPLEATGVVQADIRSISCQASRIRAVLRRPRNNIAALWWEKHFVSVYLHQNVKRVPRSALIAARVERFLVYIVVSFGHRADNIHQRNEAENRGERMLACASGKGGNVVPKVAVNVCRSNWVSKGLSHQSIVDLILAREVFKRELFPRFRAIKGGIP